jgi:hypothetical protein
MMNMAHPNLWDIEPIAMAYIYHNVTCGDGLVVEVKTWQTADQIDGCLAKWQKVHKGITPNRVVPVTIPYKKSGEYA